MLWSVGTNLADAWDMRDWVPVSGQLQSAGYTSRPGDDSTTYEAYATYSYEYRGQTYYGDRASLDTGSDNIGDFHQDLGSELAGKMSRGESVTVWVDPEAPTSAIIDRSIRWGLLGFRSIFLLVFGGVGGGILYAAWSSPKEPDKSDPMFANAPWLLNKDWQSETVFSSSRSSMWAAWAFAAIWNLISAPLPWIAYEEIVEKDNTIAFVALLFPIVGVGLLVWAIRQTLEWRRFGRTPVVLDPFPGSIGGQVGGTIDLGLRFDSTNRFLITLTSIHSYTSGSGDNRRTSERALWQEELVAHAESSIKGTRLSFEFDVPEGQRESDPKQRGDSYHLWRLSLQADLPGTDLGREFNIPVFATAQQSRRLSSRNYASSQSIQQDVYDRRVREVARISSDGMRKKLTYPMFRNVVSNAAAMLIGGTFAAAGWYLIVEEGQRAFGSIFGGVGALVAISATYMMFKSLVVSRDGNTIRSVRRFLGIPIKSSEMRLSDFYRFETTSGTQHQNPGGKHTLHYKVSAIANDATEVLLGEGFRGKQGADAAIRMFERELGLSAQQEVSRVEPGVSLFLKKRLAD